MSSQREASTPLGTPISSLQGAAIFQRSVASEVANEIVENDDYLFDDDEEDIYDEDEDDEEQPGSRAWVVKSLQKMAWFTTRMTVVKPLASAAPVARLIAILFLEHLACWLPEHVVSDVAKAVGSFAAKSATLLRESEEGQRASSAMEQFTRQLIDCVSSAEGETLVYESSEAAVKLARALRSPQAIEFYDALERSAHASLDLAASDEASRLVADGRRALDAVLDLLASERSITVLDEAVTSVAIALSTRRKARGPNNEKMHFASRARQRSHNRSTSSRTPEPTGDNLDETLSECGSDEDVTLNDNQPKKNPSAACTFTHRHIRNRSIQQNKNHKTKKSAKRIAKKESRYSILFTLCAYACLLGWIFFGIIGFIFIFLPRNFNMPPSSPIFRFDLSSSSLFEDDTLPNGVSSPSSTSTFLYKVDDTFTDAPRPLQSCTYEPTALDLPAVTGIMRQHDDHQNKAA